MKKRFAAAAASLVLPSALLLPVTSAAAATVDTTGRVVQSDEPLAKLSQNREVLRFLEQNTGSGEVRAQADEDPAPTGATIVSPATGTDVAGAFQVTVSRGGAVNLSLWVDGEPVEVDASSDETVVFDLNLSGPAGGLSHTIEVGDCATGYCLSSDAGDVTDSITVTAYPADGVDVTSASSSGYFSPNGDGVKDSVTVQYTTQVAGALTATVSRTEGAAVVRTVQLGSKAAGASSFVWNGKDDAGTVVGGGGYRVVISLATSGGSTSSDSVDVVLDTTKPAFSSVTQSDSKVFARKDKYRDWVTFSAKPTERASLMQLKITNSNGKTVRTLSAKSVYGTASLKWSGRTSSGKLLPEGTYKYRWTATDLAGNVRTTSSARSIIVDNRILKLKVRTKTVKPSSVKFDGYVDDCAKIVKNPNGWSGAHGFRSYCDFVEGDPVGQAWLFYKLTLPKAVKYGTVRVGALGRASVFKRDGETVYSQGGLSLLGLDTAEKKWYVASNKVMAPSYKYYWTGSKSISSLDFGRKVVWEAGTNNNLRYDVRTFKVKWSYYVLVD